MMKVLLNYLTASLAAYALATVSATQYALAELERMGLEISLGTRLEVTLHDLAGMSPVMLTLVAVGFAIAFPVAAWLSRHMPSRRQLLFMLAGAVALLTIHLLIKWALDIWMILVARTSWGLLVQCLAGAAGGALFARMTSRAKVADT